jgi:hypothetical protein|tara:strand:- start:1175 stop:2242 length:1068 start_codon:yes stop_codon:yes gene_type:complete
MAAVVTFLTLVNDVLRELNEVEITDVSTTSGFTKYVNTAVNRAIRDIYNEEIEWPFAVETKTDATVTGQQDYDLPSSYRQVDWESFFLYPTDLVTNGAFATSITSWTDSSTGTGSFTHTTDGNGRARLAGGSSGVGIMEQSVTTVDNKTYVLDFRIFGGAVNLQIGTSTGASDIQSSTAYTISDTGAGEFHRVEFDATSNSSYIQFSNSTNANHDVDFSQSFFKEEPVKLEYMDLEEWENTRRTDEKYQEPGSFSVPDTVVRRQNDKYSLSNIPNSDQYTVEYKYWVIHTDVTVNSSTIGIPDRWKDAIREQALFYCYRFRQDMAAASDASRNYKDIVASMRTELIQRPQNFRAR